MAIKDIVKTAYDNSFKDYEKHQVKDPHYEAFSQTYNLLERLSDKNKKEEGRKYLNLQIYRSLRRLLDENEKDEGIKYLNDLYYG